MKWTQALLLNRTAFTILLCLLFTVADAEARTAKNPSKTVQQENEISNFVDYYEHQDASNGSSQKEESNEVTSTGTDFFTISIKLDKLKSGTEIKLKFNPDSDQKEKKSKEFKASTELGQIQNYFSNFRSSDKSIISERSGSGGRREMECGGDKRWSDVLNKCVLLKRYRNFKSEFNVINEARRLNRASKTETARHHHHHHHHNKKHRERSSQMSQ